MFSRRYCAPLLLLALAVPPLVTTLNPALTARPAAATASPGAPGLVIGLQLRGAGASPAGGGWSLSTMRRRPDAPNGLTEFLIVETVEWAKTENASELSLNFCAFTDVISPERATSIPKRFARRILLAADNVFQLERLYSFNRKFFPEWRRRYVCIERYGDIPAVGLAYLRAESLLVPPGPWTRRREARKRVAA